jgi:hypothetical protein
MKLLLDRSTNSRQHIPKTANCFVIAHKQLPWSTTQQTKLSKLISHAVSPHVQPKIP